MASAQGGLGLRLLLIGDNLLLSCLFPNRPHAPDGDAPVAPGSTSTPPPATFPGADSRHGAHALRLPSPKRSRHLISGHRRCEGCFAGERPAAEPTVCGTPVEIPIAVYSFFL